MPILGIRNIRGRGEPRYWPSI